MKHCLAMQHVAFEDLGAFAPVLEAEGFSIRYCPVGAAPTEEEWLDADLAVVLGGPIGVYDQVLYPILEREKELVRLRLVSASARSLSPPCSTPASIRARKRKSAGAPLS